MYLLKRIKYKIKYLIWKQIIVDNFDRFYTKVLGILKSKVLNSNNSFSSNTRYPDFALKAVMDPSIYSIFRRHYEYTKILEHTDKSEAEKI